jgi:hypothetical protein
MLFSRDPRIGIIGTTWELGYVGAAGPAYVLESVRGHLKDIVDEFINAYLAVNPKAR